MSHYQPGKTQFWALLLVNLLLFAGLLGFIGR